MTNLESIGGALIVLFGIGHMAGDWLFQTQKMAENKTKDPVVRAKHCAIYTLCVGLLMLFWRGTPQAWNGQWVTFGLLIAWLYFSHFIIDSYKPLFWYRKLTKDPYAQTIEQFKERFNTPAGFVVYVTLDQVFHLFCLLPVANVLVTLSA